MPMQGQDGVAFNDPYELLWSTCSRVLMVKGSSQGNLWIQTRNRRLAGEVQSLQQAAAAAGAALAAAQGQIRQQADELRERKALVERLERDLLSA